MTYYQVDYSKHRWATLNPFEATGSPIHKLEAEGVLVPVTEELMSRAEWEAQNDKPWLGLATNRQLLEELTVRLEMDGMLDYRTVDGEQFPVDVAVKGET